MKLPHFLILIVTLLFLLTPITEAQSTTINSYIFPSRPSYGDTYNITETITNTRHIYWNMYETRLCILFHPLHDDVQSPNGGKWKHLTTHEQGISWNITTNRLLNDSDITYLYDTPFILDHFEVSFGKNYSSVVHGVSEGIYAEATYDKEVSEEELQDGVLIQLILRQNFNDSLMHCYFLTSIDISLTFMTTYWFFVFFDYHYTTTIDSLPLLVVIVVVVIILTIPILYLSYIRLLKIILNRQIQR